MTIRPDRAAEFKAIEAAESRALAAQDLLRYRANKAAAVRASGWVKVDPDRRWVKNRVAFTNLAIDALMSATRLIARYGRPEDHAAVDLLVLGAVLAAAEHDLEVARRTSYVEQRGMIETAELDIHFTRERIAALTQFLPRSVAAAAE
jgi:hypothetical protein